MFKVEVIGNLGADCEVKEANGSKFAVLRVAHSTRYTDQQGQQHETTDWIDGILNDVNAKVIPYLRQGVKVFIRGNASMRVYSSPKDRMMKAGITVNIWEIELCGGTADDVPRRLVVPESGQLVDVVKCYWVPLDTRKMKKDESKILQDMRGNQYSMNNNGFVSPVADKQQEQAGAEQTETASQQG